MVRIQTVDIGCEPSPSVPAETLLADGGRHTFCSGQFSKDVGESGRLDDRGVAVLDCQGCVACKFGYPNDEGLAEHPLGNLELRFSLVRT